jgi:hypothetical protein
MQGLVTVGLSLVGGQTLRNQIDDLATTENRHMVLGTRVRLQARGCMSALSSLDLSGLSRGLSDGNSMIVPLAIWGIHRVAAGVVGMATSSPPERLAWSQRIHRWAPRVVTGAMVVTAAVATILQPLASVGLLLHALVAIADRQRWISSAVSSRLLMASTVAGLAIGLMFGPLLIKAFLALEVLAFVLRRLGSVQERLGMGKPQPVQGNPRAGEPLVQSLMREQIPAEQSRPNLIRAQLQTTSRMFRATSPDIWTGEQVLPEEQWQPTFERVRAELQALEELERAWQREQSRFAPVLAAIQQLNQLQHRDADESWNELPPELIEHTFTRYEAKLRSLRDALGQLELNDRLALQETDADMEARFTSLRLACDERDYRSGAGMSALWSSLGVLQRNTVNFLDRHGFTGLRNELNIVRDEFGHDGRSVISGVLEAFSHLNARAADGDFGPGSIRDPEMAKRGWGACLAALSSLVPAESALERKAVAMKLITQLVAASDSCSAATLRAIQDTYAAAIGIDRLSEGFLGFLQTIRSEEVASWSQNTWLRLPKRALEAMAEYGIPGSRMLSRWLARPTVEKSLAGAEAMPWLETSYEASKGLVRRSQLSDYELVSLSLTRLAHLSKDEITARLGEVGLVSDQAVVYLLSEEGRVAWHAALRQQEFRDWVMQQLPEWSERNLQQLALPDPQQLARPEGFVVPDRLWLAALLLMRRSGILMDRS